MSAHALVRRYGRAASETLSVSQVEQLPVGSILWFDSRAWMVVPGGLAPTAVRPERAGSRPPDGEAVASFGGPFTLVSRGDGKVLTHGTADRKVIVWYQAQRR